MGLFNKYLELLTFEDGQVLTDNDIKKIKNEIGKTKDGYVQVEGYKGMNQDMICDGGYSHAWTLRKNIKRYDMNVVAATDSDPLACKTGFHLCKYLHQVFGYYKFDFKNRFFKVLALVKYEDYQNWNEKIASKILIPIEEVTPMFDEVCDVGGGIYYKGAYFKEHDYRAIMIDQTFATPEDLLEAKFIQEMKEYGICDELCSFVFRKISFDKCDQFISMVKALRKQNVSDDAVATAMIYMIKR